jgi:two-component system, sensor histidine kinase
MLETDMSSDAPQSNHEAAVRRELLRLALLNSTRSVPLQLVAVGVVVIVGLMAGALLGAGLAATTGLAVAAWRLWLGRRFGNGAELSEQRIALATRGLEGNSALAGILWTICSFGIYPQLQGTMATVYVVIAIGSTATAALFMSLVGRSFELLVFFGLGSVVAVSLLVESVRSIPLAILVGIFALTMSRAAREVGLTTARAIRHRLHADSANRSLLHAKDAAEAANVAKSQFLATMSHEIRTPMNGVLGALDLLRHSDLNADQRRLVRTAASSGASLMAILDDVLDHSKIEAGKLSLTAAPMSPQAVATSVVALFRANALGKGLTLTLDVEPGLQEWVIGDAQRLKQVLLNLVGNAIKFTERGGVTLRLSTAPAPAGRAGIRFEVRDSGVGISAEAMGKLFQPFHQVDDQRHRRRGGTGLGLVISQSIVEAMGGKIEVDSEAGAGSCFRFVLTLERQDAAPEQPVPVDSSLAGLDDNGLQGTVLVVEDNDVNRMIAREMLASLGLSVVEADDGKHALDQLAKHPVDLILMDCQMPVMDGYAASREIRKREQQAGGSHIPILALTANAFDQDAAKAREAGMDAHLAKPYTRAELQKMLTAWL